MIARARNSDPTTSHEAAATVERGGTASNQRERCLREVRMRPGLTAAEIAIRVGMERHVPSRRLPELREAGLVLNHEARICTVTLNRSLTWWPKQVDGGLF